MKSEIKNYYICIGLEFECPDEFVICILFKIIVGRRWKTVMWCVHCMLCLSKGDVGILELYI